MDSTLPVSTSMSHLYLMDSGNLGASMLRWTVSHFQQIEIIHEIKLLVV